jgi:hypothetical protein
MPQPKAGRYCAALRRRDSKSGTLTPGWVSVNFLEWFIGQNSKTVPLSASEIACIGSIVYPLEIRLQ